MKVHLQEPGHVDEPEQGKDYAEVLSRVAAEQQPIIVRRGGTALAAVIPLEYLELLQDLMARQEAEYIAAQLDWDNLIKKSPPPQSWFNADEPKPF